MTSLLCMLGRHTRSRGRARREGAYWTSRCRRCNRPMLRSDNGKWRLDRGEAEVEIEVADDFSAAPEADRPTRGLRKWLPRISFRRIRVPRLKLFRRKARD